MHHLEDHTNHTMDERATINAYFREVKNQEQDDAYSVQKVLIKCSY